MSWNGLKQASWIVSVIVLTYGANHITNKSILTERKYKVLSKVDEQIKKTPSNTSGK